MTEEQTRYYILFENYEQGMALHDLLDKAGLRNRIAPAPRCIKEAAACGMSLLIEESEIEAVKAYIKVNHGEYRSIIPLSGQIRPTRDHYC